MNPRSLKSRDARKSGGGGVAFVILILLVAAGVAFWFLFKPSDQIALRSGEAAVGSSGVPVSAELASEAAEMNSESMEPVAVSASGEALPMTEAGEVDWPLRQRQLIDAASKSFKPPKIGVNAAIQLASGAVVKGQISGLTKDTIRLRIGSGHATYKRSLISPRSQVAIFEDVFVRYTAQQALAAEKLAAGQGPE